MCESPSLRVKTHKALLERFACVHTSRIIIPNHCYLASQYNVKDEDLPLKHSLTGHGGKPDWEKPTVNSVDGKNYN